MAPLGRKSVYIDTNVFIFARASKGFSKKHRNLQYYKSGKECVKVLRTCRKNEIVVYSSMIARVELQTLQLDWSTKRRLMDLNLPPGFAFGESHRNDDGAFVRDLFSSTERSVVFQELDSWFKSWEFDDLIRWARPGDIPYWEELATFVLRYALSRRQLADALHLAAAIGLGCTQFFTTDGNLRRVIGRMRDDMKMRRELEKLGLIDKGYGLPDAITDSSKLVS